MPIWLYIFIYVYSLHGFFRRKQKRFSKQFYYRMWFFRKSFFSSYPFDTCVFVRIHTNMCSALLLLSKSYNMLLCYIHGYFFKNTSCTVSPVVANLVETHRHGKRMANEVNMHLYIHSYILFTCMYVRV